MRVEVQAAGPLRGELRLPSDKSLTHRALMLAAAARSSSEVHNPLRGADCLSTLGCLVAMGLRYRDEGSTWTLLPVNEWMAPQHPLDCGNSGTTMRLLSGLLASRPLEATLVGDASLSRRPMKRIAEPLRLMGATVEGDSAPLRISGRGLVGIEYTLPVASAQIKSCLLLAGLRASTQTTVHEPHPSRDHTERMLAALGVRIERISPVSSKLEPFQVFEGFRMKIPADISSAAFWMVAGALIPGSEIRLTEVGTNPTRTGILDVLQQAGAQVEHEPGPEELGEPTGDLIVRSSNDLRPFTISGDLVPRLIDEIPVLAVLATQCHGETVIRDAGELRVKESDRIQVVADGLRNMGAQIETTEDGMVIFGPTPLTGTAIDAEGDHRIAMAFSVAGMIASGSTTIDHADSVLTSYPTFFEDMKNLQGVPR